MTPTCPQRVCIFGNCGRSDVQAWPLTRQMTPAAQRSSASLPLTVLLTVQVTARVNTAAM